MKLKDYIYIGLISVLVLLLVFRKPGISEKEHQQKKMIDSLTTDINHKNEFIKLLDKQLIVYDDSIAKFKNTFNNNDKKIKEIHKNYEDKVRIIDSYDVDQLESFFSNRYKDSTE